MEGKEDSLKKKALWKVKENLVRNHYITSLGIKSVKGENYKADHRRLQTAPFLASERFAQFFPNERVGRNTPFNA